MTYKKVTIVLRYNLIYIFVNQRAPGQRFTGCAVLFYQRYQVKQELK